MKEGLLERIGRQLEAGALDALTRGLQPTDLQSLLLEVYRRRVGALTPADVLRQYREHRFVRPAGVSPLALRRVELAAFELLQGRFEAIEPSPLSPLGCASVLGPVDQNNVVSTVRNTDVASDPTNLMALECALRRRVLLQQGQPAEPVRLCASQRLVRVQPTNDPNSFPHFQIFALCSAGRGAAFEREAFAEHAGFYASLAAALSRQGYRFGPLELEIVQYDAAAERLARELGEQAAGLDMQITHLQRFDQTYYRGVGFHIYALDVDGNRIFLADGGPTDWTQQLLGDRRERLMISAIGTERLIHCFDRRSENSGMRRDG